jgi:hypothetical protein
VHRVVNETVFALAVAAAQAAQIGGVRKNMVLVAVQGVNCEALSFPATLALLRYLSTCVLLHGAPAIACTVCKIYVVWYGYFWSYFWIGRGGRVEVVCTVLEFPVI